MRYRSALNRCWAAVSIAWIGWCLYWPFYARQQDMRTIQAEAAETYNICSGQKGLTAADCATDRTAYSKLHRGWVAPAGENAYQTFAGKRLPDVLSFLTVLCLVPILTGYVVLRAVLEIVLWFARVRPQDTAAGDDRITSGRESLDA